MPFDVDDALMRVIENEGSDLHVKVPSPPLIRRHGKLEPLEGEEPLTLDEVGRAFNVTRERIRQIEHHTLKKLRALAEAQKLREVA